MSALFLALALGACALWELGNDDSGATAADACPIETVLGTEDLPCFCQSERITELPYAECMCTVDGTFTCRDGSTDTGLWPTR